MHKKTTDKGYEADVGIEKVMSAVISHNWLAVVYVYIIIIIEYIYAVMLHISLTSHYTEMNRILGLI